MKPVLAQMFPDVMVSEEGIVAVMKILKEGFLSYPYQRKISLVTIEELHWQVLILIFTVLFFLLFISKCHSTGDSKN